MNWDSMALCRVWGWTEWLFPNFLFPNPRFPNPRFPNHLGWLASSMDSDRPSIRMSPLSRERLESAESHPMTDRDWGWPTQRADRSWTDLDWAAIADWVPIAAASAQLLG
jgi:hypothetical protein